MKKKQLLFCILCVAIIVTGSLFLLRHSGMDFSTGICIQADNGSTLVILDGSPIVMQGKADQFAKLQTGDLLFIIHDDIDETYPGQTGVRFAQRIGKERKLPSHIVNNLMELGWLTLPMDDSQVAWEDPPVLMVSSGRESIYADRLSSVWEYTYENGTFSGTTVDSISPLDAAQGNSLPVLTIKPSTLSSIDPHQVSLQFATQPVCVTVRCWLRGENESAAQSIEVSDSRMVLPQGQYIYELTATFEASDYHGTAIYAFESHSIIMADD